MKNNTHATFTPSHLLKTPVLFLIFNRLDTTKQVFEAIRLAKPPRLYIAADGPRDDKTGEGQKIQAVREYVMNNISWDCEVEKLFREKNLGCKYAVSGAINWFFENEEIGIILEDDCLPSQSFFWFCQELLERYRYDERVMAVSGCNFQFGKKRTEYSYYFSRYCHVWGWASWKRAWKLYDVNITLWPQIRDKGWINDILDNKKEGRYWTKILESVYKGNIDTWDYQWLFACWIQNGLTVIPNSNLVCNIGFNTMATHTRDGSRFTNMPLESTNFPLLSPPFVIRDTQADNFTSKIMFNLGLFTRAMKRLRLY